MKTIQIIIFATISNVCLAQDWYCGGVAMPSHQYFETITTVAWDQEFSYSIDTTSPNNIWQVCKPIKSVIDSAESSPYSILTDSINPYPINNVSSFTLLYEFDSYMSQFWGKYWVNTDSLNDYGIIEYSPDNGITWINIIDSMATWNSIPILTGNSNGWQNFEVNIQAINLAYSVLPGDTVLFKFTFISDSITDTLDGLAFDSFRICDGIESVNENDFLINQISIAPNPTTDKFFINSKIKDRLFANIYDSYGKLIDTFIIHPTNLVSTDQYENGLYLIKFYTTDSELIGTKKLIIGN